jgi:glycosyltransferase involved in cell wall biosynthesis
MRIAIDARELGGNPTGVGRFLSEVVRQWAELPAARHHEYIFCAPADIVLPDGLLNARTEIAVGSGTRWEQLVLPRLVRRSAADVLFAVGYSAPLFSPVPVVVAIYDVSFAAHPEWFSWRQGLRRRIVTRASARRAARVITISEFSRREIVEHLGIPDSRIAVIYPGAPPRCHGRSATHPTTDGSSVVLYVGSLFNRRHIPELIEGFTALSRRRSNLRLEVVGDNRLFPATDVTALARHSGAGDRIHLRAYVTDDVLRDLYRTARVFVFLSEYEGFGLTPLEALAAGVPPLVLDTPVAREVCGAAALYVARPDPILIEAALERALYDETTRAAVLDAAEGVLARYSWRQCAAGVLAVLEGATSEPS